jgi:uncharacterized membrane protein YhaH (DUF805 family)
MKNIVLLIIGYWSAFQFAWLLFNFQNRKENSIFWWACILMMFIGSFIYNVYTFAKKIK